MLLDIFGPPNRVVIPPSPGAGGTTKPPADSYPGVPAFLAYTYKKDGEVTATGMAVLIGKPDAKGIYWIKKTDIDAAYVGGEVNEDIYVAITGLVPPGNVTGQSDDTAWFDVAEIALFGAAGSRTVTLSSYQIRDVPKGFTPRVYVETRLKPDGANTVPANAPSVFGLHNVGTSTPAVSALDSTNKRVWTVLPSLFVSAAAASDAIPTNNIQYRLHWTLVQDN